MTLLFMERCGEYSSNLQEVFQTFYDVVQTRKLMQMTNVLTQDTGPEQTRELTQFWRLGHREDMA